jgi:uncharacterized protein
MIFDFRVFVGQSFDGTQQTVDDLLRSMDSLGIDKALACPFKPLSYNLDQANFDLATAIHIHSDRLLGAARIDPWQPGAAESLCRSLEQLNLRALYLNPWEEHFRADLERLDFLMEAAQTHHVPVLVATGYPWVSEVLQVKKLADRWPALPVIMSNGGQINISGLGQADASLALKQSPNLCMDTAGVYRQDFIEETVSEIGGERVLFGSGAPYFDQRFEVKRVLYAKVDPVLCEAMQSGNALKILGLSV